jgi:hypothetical protein
VPTAATGLQEEEGKGSVATAVEAAHSSHLTCFSFIIPEQSGSFKDHAGVAT